MTKFYTPLFLMCFLFFNTLNAQVSFTNQGALLGPASGSLEDCAVDMNGDYLDDVVRIVNTKIYIDYQQANGTFNHVEHTVNMQNLPTWSLCAGDIDGRFIDFAISIILSPLQGSFDQLLNFTFCGFHFTLESFQANQKWITGPLCSNSCFRTMSWIYNHLISEWN